MARIYPENLPAHYVQDHHAQVTGWASGEYGRLMRDFAPRVFPGIPWQAWLGFASNGTVNERTSADERGTFGIEGARYEGLRNDPTVVALLGRGAAADPGWMGSQGGLADQIATGLVNQRRHLEGVRANIDARIRPSTSSPWAAALSFAGWSAGDGGAASQASRYAGKLALVSEAERFQEWGRLLAGDLASGALAPGAESSYRYPFHTWIRTQQKIRCAVDAGCPAEWFLAGSGRDIAWIEDIVARAASGLSATGSGASPGRGSAWGFLVPVGVLGAVGAGLLWLTRKRTR